ncbi:immunoglobulin domain-containing protein [Mucilaginibacter sp. UYCu711]|uniref:immunoglobulin domain-containing protein n=1 Tax=Mucilaginibacter sp. UYCu711 TaxID=3156339 RepID=UPI003D244FC9
MPITIQKGTTSAYFKITKPEKGTIEICVVNDYNLIKETDGTISLIKNADHFPLIDSVDPSTIINGDTNEFFADYDDLESYVINNFFREAGGGAGINDIYELPTNVWDVAAHSNAYRVVTGDTNISVVNEPTGNYSGILRIINSGYLVRFMDYENVPLSDGGVPISLEGMTVIILERINGTYYPDSNGTAPEVSIPVIIDQPAAENLTEGEELSLSVGYTGNPTPTIQWQKSADNLNFTDISGATSSTYSKISVMGDAGYYRAVVSNTAGSVTSVSAHVIVYETPALQELSINLSTNIATEVLNSGSDFGGQAPKYIGKKRYQSADGANPGTILTHGSLGAGEAGSIQISTRGFVPARYDNPFSLLCRLFFRTSNVDGDFYTNGEFGAIIGAFQLLAVGNSAEGGIVISPSPENVTDVLLYRNASGYCALRTSDNDGVSFTDQYTFADSYAAELWVGIELVDGPISYTTNLLGLNIN